MQTWTYPARLEQLDGEVLVSFRDIPEALTGGASIQEARGLAADALEIAVVAYLSVGREPPLPSTLQRDEEWVPLAPLTAARAALVLAMREEQMTSRGLAARMRQPEAAVRRLLDGAGGVNVDAVLSALAALGRSATLATT